MEENIWSNEWYGHHIIGLDCEWCDGQPKSTSENSLHKHIVSVALLKKYIAHVQDCEGIDYVDEIGSRPSYQEFTDEEKQLLERLSEEVSNER